jgi:hypothetical protein
MSFFHGINYLHRSALIFMALLLSGFMLATGRVPALVSYQTVQKLGFLSAMLQICEFYRQRFYLSPRKEWGFHWRVALLQYAKWPYFLVAFLDALFNKDKPYELTEKVKSRLAKRPLLWPNLLVIVLLAEPLFAEWVLEVNVNPIVQLVVVVLLVTSGALVWTDLWCFPAPFDKAILENSLLNEHETNAHKNPEWLLPDKQILGENGAQERISHDAVSFFHAGQAMPKTTDPIPGLGKSPWSKDSGLR